MKKLSILIPHYNSSLELERLLNSIPNNNLIEIIIVDDHSSQKHVTKLNELNKNNGNQEIKILFNESGRKSAGAARNKALEFATGDWILFADSDDYFLSGFYEIVNKYFYSDNDIVFFIPTSIYNDTKELAQRHFEYKELIRNFIIQEDEISESRLRYDFTVPWSKLYRASFIKEHSITFDEVMYSNDVMFSTKSGFYADKIETSTDVIYCVTRDKGSLTSTLNEQIFDIRLEVSLRKFIFLKENLSKEGFKKLGMSGRPALIRARQFGISKVIKVYKILRVHRIKIVSFKIFNPIWIINRYKKIRRKEKDLKRYLN